MLSTNESFAAIVNSKAREAFRDFAYGMTENHSVNIEGQGGKDAIIQKYVDDILAIPRHKSQRYNLFLTEPADIVYYGASDINLQEFQLLHELLHENGLSYSSKRFLQAFQHSDKPSPAPTRAMQAYIRRGITEYLQPLRPVTPGHLRQIWAFARSFMQLHQSYSGRPETLPRLAVVANDHTPEPVAFYEVMRAFGSKTAYLQHAEVTRVFPPLEFDISVLRSSRAVAEYALAGPAHGSVHVINRSNARQSLTVSGRHPIDPIDNPVVGLYPTSEFDAEMLKRAAQKLKHNSGVAGWFVKPHPRSMSQISSEEAAQLNVRTEMPAERHVAIAGNSSVAIDLLAAGNRVFQMFSLDDIKPDYYGFVRGALIPELKEADLERPFYVTDFYSQDWLDRSAAFGITYNGDQVAARAAVASTIAGRLAEPNELGVKAIGKILDNSDDPVFAADEWLTQPDRLDVKVMVISHVKRAMRTGQISNSMATGQRLKPEAAHFWLNMHLAKASRRTLTNDEAAIIRQGILQEPDPKIRRIYTNDAIWVHFKDLRLDRAAPLVAIVAAESKLSVKRRLRSWIPRRGTPGAP
jgi:hypothetical protein